MCEVITVSSDSETSVNEDDNLAGTGLPNFYDDYCVDWSVDENAHSPINYNADLQHNESKKLEEIEDFVTPSKEASSQKPVELSDSIYKIDDSFTESNNHSSQKLIVHKSNTEKDGFQSTQSNKTKSRQKLSQEEKESMNFLKEQKKMEREKLKAEELRQKTIKSVLSMNQKYLKPEENIKFLKVHINSEIINSVCGGNIITLLQENSIQYEVDAFIERNTISWSKRRIKKIVDDFGNIKEQVENTEEKQMLYIIDWLKAVELVDSNELLSHVEAVKSIYPDKKLTVILYGLEKYFDYKRVKLNRDLKAKVNNKKPPKPKPSERNYEDAPKISRDQLEFALTEMQLLGKHNSRLLEKPEELSTLVLNFTKSLSQIELKLDKQKRQDSNLGWLDPGDSIRTVKVDKNGSGLLLLWQQQICQFPSVGIDTAQAIVSNYESPLKLFTEYENCDENVSQSELLLQDIQIRREAGILSSTRRIGPQLSKKIHKFFTSDDPDVEL